MADLCDLFILDFLIGEDNLDDETREYKLSNLRKGLYDDFHVTIEFPRDLDEKRFETIEDYLKDLTLLRKSFYLSLWLEPPFQRTIDKQTVKVKRAKQLLLDFYLMKMHFRIDMKKNALNKIQNEAIIFIDEIDKIVHSKGSTSSNGRSPSTEGVQRDLLPLIEGTTIQTKFGDVSTNHILFVCSGAFNNTKPSDLMPEFLGRLPLQINLKALTRKDFEQILTGVEYNLLHQHKELLKTEGLDIEFTQEGIERICELSEEMNLSTENIGARRLHSVLEKVLEEISYEGPDWRDEDSEHESKKYVICTEYVDKMMEGYREKNDYTKYLL